MADLHITWEEYNKKTEQLAAMVHKDGSLHPFTGPIYDQAGELRVAEGEVADDFMMATMDWYVQGIDGELPQ